MDKSFIPKLFTVLKEGYTKRQFTSDALAGLIVGIVALPLAISFAIASGVSPEKGLITAVIAGVIISAFGGSRVQIGGPTGAFIVIVFDIVNRHGVDGLTVATFMAGIVIVVFGITRLGGLLRYIPYPLIVGFTSGIAVIIFTAQLKDFFGLQVAAMPADFIGKWGTLFNNMHTVNFWSVILAGSTIVIIRLFSRLTSKIPGSVVAILLATVIVAVFDLPVETIESRFGEIPSSIPAPKIPNVDFETIRELLGPAFAIAMLGTIESLLSAVVADGMTSGKHRSNIELVAQGAANIFSSIFGGIPATGAIARTATNIKNGGRTPVSGIIHAITLLIIMVFAGQWAKFIPMPCLAGILIVVAYNMSEWRSFVSMLKGQRGDVAVLLSTFLLTVVFDLVIAIEIGIVLAFFLFVGRISKITQFAEIDLQSGEDDEIKYLESQKLTIPKGVEVYEINGPLFFGAAHRFKEVARELKKHTKIIVIRMRQVPFIDATGAHNFAEVIREFQSEKIKTVLSGVRPELLEDLHKNRIDFLVGRKNILPNIEEALARASEIMEQESKHVTRSKNA